MTGEWLFFSNHGLALIAVARRSKSRIRDIARELGITERAAQGIMNDLVEAGYLDRIREGKRNRYVVRGDRPLRHPTTRGHQVSDLTGALDITSIETGEAEQSASLVLACSDHRAQGWLRSLLAGEGLLGRAEIVLWPGGGGALAGPDRDALFDVLRRVEAQSRPPRLLLVAHSGCVVPDVPTLAQGTPLATYRAAVRWGRRIVDEAGRRLEVEAELWFLTGVRPTRIRTGRSVSAGRRAGTTEAAKP